MKVKTLHSWELSQTEAIELQKTLAKRIITRDNFSEINTVCGVDVGYDKKVQQATAACVVMSYPALEVIEKVRVTTPIKLHYIPGLLSFREAPALIPAFARLKTEPDLVICDGHGLSHPRRFGLACHLGLLLDTPTIGCAKSLLIGSCSEPGVTRGSYEYIWDTGEVIGAVLRTKNGVKPVYVSTGHRIGLSSAIDFILGCTRNHRLTEPVRYADLDAV
ncbi:MAG: deoxyribonuclease V [Spirochaetota bacterium]|nr:MAG: deoxyribonuclease V [Spirochaetota bacterium]